jgi:hypothetical protein
MHTQLMGPCWLIIRKPCVQREAKSWCKVEVSITNPKSIVKMGSKTAPPPPQGTYTRGKQHTTVATYAVVTFTV